MKAFRVKRGGTIYFTSSCIVIADNILEAEKIHKEKYPDTILSIESFPEDVLIQVYE